jgi:hypothetical protein
VSEAWMEEKEREQMGELLVGLACGEFRIP